MKTNLFKVPYHNIIFISPSQWNNFFPTSLPVVFFLGSHQGRINMFGVCTIQGPSKRVVQDLGWIKICVFFTGKGSAVQYAFQYYTSQCSAVREILIQNMKKSYLLSYFYTQNLNIPVSYIFQFPHNLVSSLCPHSPSLIN